MDIRDLRFFCMAAELEHVSRAAEKLGIAQPYLTKIIGQIEAEFGTDLFDKVGRQIRLNHSGEIFYSHAKKILSDVENLYTEIDFALDRKERTISILCNTEAFTQGMIVEFQKKNANYGLKVGHAIRAEMTEDLITGKADFALCDPPINEDKLKNIKTEIVLKDTACILLPPNHPMLSLQSLTFEQMRNERLVTANKGGAMRNHVDAVFEKFGFRPKIVCETHDLNLIIQAVASDLGYAFVSHSVIDRHPELAANCRHIESPDKYGYIGLSYNNHSIDNRNGDDFRKFSLSYFENLQKRLNQLFSPTGIYSHL